MKKGCLIVVALILVCLGGLFWLGSRYDSLPKEPGEREANDASSLIMSAKDGVAHGNSPEAQEMAATFSRNLKEMRELGFSEGKEGGLSFTEGEFLVYCHLKSDSVVFLVHVPELRRFEFEAKARLATYAWELATLQVAESHPKIEQLGLGMKGVLNYSAVYTGVIEFSDPKLGIKQKHDTSSLEPLWPFFTEEKEQSSRAQ